MSSATTITNVLDGSGGVMLYNLAVNVGDTVLWTNGQYLFLGTNFVESYGGEWSSPPLLFGDTFAVTFTNAGFFAYKTGTRSAPRSGVISVRSWTEAPPPVTINTPTEGSVLCGIEDPVQASAANESELASMEYFGNSQLMATVTNAPFAFLWTPQPRPPSGDFVFLAKATDVHGHVTWSAPVHVTFGEPFYLWGSRVLPTGELLFFYNTYPLAVTQALGATDALSSFSSFANFTWLTDIARSGAFVDESTHGGAVPRRFYAIVGR